MTSSTSTSSITLLDTKIEETAAGLPHGYANILYSLSENSKDNVSDISNMEKLLMEMYDAMPIVKQIMELKVGKMTTTATTNNETSARL